MQSLADACDIFLFEDFPFLQKHASWEVNKTTPSRSEALPAKPRRKRRKGKTRPPALFGRSALVKRNYILRTRRIVSDLLPQRTAVKAKHFSVRIMIT